MWARLNDNDTIAQLYMRPVGITLDGVQYPASIFSLWSASELQALKIWSVTMTNSPSDSQYYNVSVPVYAVELLSITESATLLWPIYLAGFIVK